MAFSASTSTSSAKSLELSNYLDYRKYLVDFYHMKKQESRKALRPYTYAVFSAAADIKSPNYLKMIIEGKRNLSGDMIGKFAQALGLSKDQTEEFRILVQYGQSTDPMERNRYLKELMDIRVSHQLKNGDLTKEIVEKIPNWVGWIIYALLDQEGASFEVAHLRRALRHKASENKIQNALQVLLAAGVITQDPLTQEFKKGKNLIENVESIPVPLIRKLQSELMYLGLESLFQDSPTEREFGTLTLSLTKQEFEEVRFELRKLRKNLHKENSIKRMQAKGERIYQLNLQLFPITDATNQTVDSKGQQIAFDAML